MSRRMNCGSGLCCFAPPSARSAGFADDPLELFFGLLELFFAELLALGLNQALEALYQSRHRRFRLPSRCRHSRTLLGRCARIADTQFNLRGKLNWDYVTEVSCSATCGNGRTVGCRLFLARQSSCWACIFIQRSGEVPKAAASRRAMLAEIPDLPLSTRDRVTRVTRKCSAAADTAMLPRYSRSTEPGAGGLCMCIV
jgi:hypothetical protein